MHAGRLINTLAKATTNHKEVFELARRLHNSKLMVRKLNQKLDLAAYQVFFKITYSTAVALLHKMNEYI